MAEEYRVEGDNKAYTIAEVGQLIDREDAVTDLLVTAASTNSYEGIADAVKGITKHMLAIYTGSERPSAIQDLVTKRGFFQTLEQTLAILQANGGKMTKHMRVQLTGQVIDEYHNDIIMTYAGRIPADADAISARAQEGINAQSNLERILGARAEPATGE